LTLLKGNSPEPERAARLPVFCREFRMPNRRDVLGAGGLALAGVALGGCGSARDEYSAAAARIWRHAVAIPETLPGILTELVRLATLAPSTYNSQCWRFRASRDGITILPDPERRSPAVDPDDHHLFVSLGCAAENIVQSAASLGLYSRVEVGTEADDGLTVKFEVGVPARSQTADAIPARQTTRAAFDSKPVPAADLARLERIARAPGVTPVLVTGAVQKRRILELAAVANRAWHTSAARVAELKRWTRFDDASALATNDGLAPAPPAGRHCRRLLVEHCLIYWQPQTGTTTSWSRRSAARRGWWPSCRRSTTGRTGLKRAARFSVSHC
jgi:hypothetical protein